MADRIGQQLGNYRLVRLLGQGGFAEVYLGEHIHLGSPAAIKVLHSQLTDEDVDKFRMEARNLVRLIHPHIVRVLDFGIEERTPFLVLDYAPNGTLRQRHPKGTQLPLEVVVSYIKQIADALQFAHDEKLIHRDVKPENILLGRSNEVLLSDFGIAIVAQSSRYQNAQDLAGTIAYMAPEQIQAHPRPASDQYSLGVIIYEWLCGERPFQGSFTEIAAKHAVVPPPSLRGRVRSLPVDIENVVLTALEKDPHRRFGSVRAFANALEQASQPWAPTIIKPAQHMVLPQHVIEPSHAALTGTPQQNPPLPPSQVEALWQAQHVLEPVHVALDHTPQTLPPVLAQTETPQHPTATTRYTYRGHTSEVRAVAWSPDGQQIASGSSDHTVQVWNAINGSQALTYHGHSAAVLAIAWSPDARKIASASWDQTVQVWQAVDASPLFTYQGHSDAVLAIAWSPDSQRIASVGYDQAVQVWHTIDGSQGLSYRGHAHAVYTVAWSPDGTRIASGSIDKTVQVWNALNGSPILTYRGHTSAVHTVAWSPDGKRIASACYGGIVQVWDATNGSHVATYRRHHDAVSAVAWSPDGKRIASACYGGTAQVWNALNGSPILTYQGHTDAVRAIAWSPDGRHIVSGSHDGTAQVWQPE